jgi:DNA-binding transcriptional ArsR family regulator
VTTPAPHPPEAVVQLDARGLRALAHPVRVQLLSLLRRNGPATATGLAHRLGLTSGATSYHLRQLAAAGFVEEDTARGNARERWWRSAHRVTNLTPRIGEQEPEAATAYLHAVADTLAGRVHQAIDDLVAMERPWREATDFSDWLLRLTPGEAVRLREELRAVIDRYRMDTPDGDAPAAARRVALVVQLLPDLADDPAADPAADPGQDAS